MRILALVILTLVLGAGPASAAAWEEYIYLDRGVAIQFPARPQMTTGVHESVMVKGLPHEPPTRPGTTMSITN